MIDYAEKFRAHEAVLDPTKTPGSSYPFCPMARVPHDKHTVEYAQGYTAPCAGMPGMVKADTEGARTRLSEVEKYYRHAQERLQEAQADIARYAPEILDLRALLVPED